MSGIGLCIVILLLPVTTCIYRDLYQYCGPAEIGQQYRITSSSGNVPKTVRVEWISDSLGTLYQSEAYSFFEESLHGISYYPDRYVGTRTDLTILNAAMKNTGELFIHNVDRNEVYSCFLLTYKRASPPTCEPVTLAGNQIRTKCTTAQVFPRANCQFILQNGEIDKRNISARNSYIIYTHTDPQPGANEYYSTSCTLQYPVDGLKPGNWTVQVNMYPDLTGVSLAQRTEGQADNRLQLSVPTVNINSNSTYCPKGLNGEGDINVRNGYIRQGKPVSCLCKRAHAGNPPGTVGWRSTEGGTFDILSKSEDDATIRINSPGTFQCHSMSVLDGSHSMTYTPNYAYGPNEVTLGFLDDQLQEVPTKFLNMCGPEGLNITVTCTVKQSDVQPGLTIEDFTLRTSNTFTTQQTYLDRAEEGDYRSVNKLTVTTGGSHSVECEAKNPIFSDIKQTKSTTIEVREPPNDPPRMSARSNQNGEILVVGDDVTVTCDVSGGYPSVQSVILTCGQEQTVTNNGTSAQLTLRKIEQTCNVINCTCQATHVTGCYDLTSDLPLTVFYANPHKSEENLFTTTELVSGIIGSIVGILVLEAVIALIVLFIRREKGKRNNRAEDKEYDTIQRQPPQPYQNVKPRDPNYQTINPSEQAPNIASANQVTERTYNNQAFGGYEEPIEPEPNAYSEIQVD